MSLAAKILPNTLTHIRGTYLTCSTPAPLARFPAIPCDPPVNTSSSWCPSAAGFSSTTSSPTVLQTPTSKPPQRVAVIGGGFVGVSCALHLLLRGHEVHLFDRDQSLGTPTAASYGLAGIFANYECVPINNPSLPLKLPGYLLSSEGPLSLRPTFALLRMLPWMLHFLRYCAPAEVLKSTKALAALLHRAEDGYTPLLALLPPEDLTQVAVRREQIFLYGDEATWQANQGKIRKQRDHGMEMQMLDRADILALEPNLRSEVCHRGVTYEGTWFLRSPARLVELFAQAILRQGGRIHAGCHVTSLSGTRGNMQVRCAGPAADASDSDSGFDQVVVACGAWSNGLCESVGDSALLDTEGGYHVTFPAGSSVLSRPVGWAGTGFYMTPMEGGLRVAGTVELGGAGSAPDPARLAMIERVARSLFRPDLGPRACEGGDWMGFRPSMPDALPVIGRSPQEEGVVYAFGHQHLGFTMAGVTGHLVGQVVDGESPDVDLAPYRIDRFGSTVFL